MVLWMTGYTAVPSPFREPSTGGTRASSLSWADRWRLFQLGQG